MAILRLITLTLILITTVASHNITDILTNFPEYSVFNDFLTQTKLSDEINARQTITVLVLNNSVMTQVIANKQLSVIKTVLSIHVLLDYFDEEKLMNIGSGTMITTTLYQTTGNALGNTGFVNITDMPGGKVGFGSGQGESKLTALFEKSVKEAPYSISVLEINSPILAPGILNGGTVPPTSANVSNLLENAGCKKFGTLLRDTGVLGVYETTSVKAITIFAPSDEAFKVKGLPDFGKLSTSEFVSLLLYHAIPRYVPKVSLAMEKNKNVSTLASNEIQKFLFTVKVKTASDVVSLDTHVDVARVESVVVDSAPIAIFKIENVLLPIEFFNGTSIGAPKAGAPAPGPSAAPGPKSSNESPRPVSGSPTSAPADGPDRLENPAADVGDSDASGAGDGKVMFLALVIVSILMPVVFLFMF